MSRSALASERLRDAFEWWRAAGRGGRPPLEADYFSQDPRAYAQLLADAFILEASGGGRFGVRFVGTELADHLGWAAPVQELDPASDAPDFAVIRDLVARTAATLRPHAAFGRILSPPGATSVNQPAGAAFEAICVPLTTSGGAQCFFGALALEGFAKLPSTRRRLRVRVERIAPILADDGASDPDSRCSAAGQA
jgi:hypothetical protein